MGQLQDILNITPQELALLLKAIGEKPYRARQILSWIFHEKESSFDKMTNLPLSFRKALKENFRIGTGELKEVDRSADGATAKYLFKLDDGALVETVSMLEDKRRTVCVSSQVGCAMDCAFCATAKLGFKRNLAFGEIVLQLLTVSRAEGAIANVVFMGMGEPLLNLEAVLSAIEVLIDAGRFGLGARKITISTCGIVPGIERLAQSPIQFRLALSLNSPFQEQRAELMPVARKYPLPAVLNACQRYREMTGRRATLEYILLHNVNTGKPAARQLAQIARQLGRRVNLIEFNPASGIPFASPLSRETLRFRKWLEEAGIAVTIRFRRGREIAAGCGQLAGKTTGKKSGALGCT